jgi:hypothetical protein
LKFLILVASDYPPATWGHNQRLWTELYLEASVKYFKEVLSSHYGKANPEISYRFECPDADSNEETLVYQEDSLNEYAKTAIQNGFTALILLSNWHAYYEYIDPECKNPSGIWFDRDNSHFVAGWSFIHYRPPIVGVPRFVWRYLLGLSHEWTHWIVNKFQLFQDADLDFPPYSERDASGRHVGYAQTLFEGQFPLQTLRPGV